MHTPWGASQTTWKIADGITEVSTAGHGGILLDAARVAAMPDYMKGCSWAGAAAYEEDCDWCMPVLVFEAEYRAYYASTGQQNVDEIFESARSTLKHSHPDAYETFYGVTLQPGESRARDEAAFYASHANDWIVSAAWGSWQKGVPEGMVGVCAVLGGRSATGNAKDAVEKYFLVPDGEYAARTGFGFVIDLERHKETSYANGEFLTPQPANDAPAFCMSM